MRKIIYILFLFIISLPIEAQNNSVFLPFNQYMFNTLLYNPAYAGTKESFSMEAIYRKQWIGMKGTPEMQAITAHSPLSNNKIALGIQVDNLAAGGGAERSNNVFAYYSHRFDVGGSKLRLGMRGGLSMISKNLYDIERKFQEDPAFVDESYFMPNFGVGAYYYNNIVYAGISIPFLISLKDTVRGITSNIKKYNFTGTAGVLLTVNENFKIKPTTYLQYTIDNPFLYILSTSFIFVNDIVWITGSYKSSGAIVGILEFQITKQIRFGYSYDFAVGDLKGFMAGSHEILLRYDFSYSVRAVNPGYFW